MPKVYNKHHNNVPRDAVYVGRGSPFGNPFLIGKDGTRSDVIELYKKYVQSKPELEILIKNKLKGKDLICFCKPALCHADYLIEIANS